MPLHNSLLPASSNLRASLLPRNQVDDMLFLASPSTSVGLLSVASEHFRWFFHIKYCISLYTTLLLSYNPTLQTYLYNNLQYLQVNNKVLHDRTHDLQAPYYHFLLLQILSLPPQPSHAKKQNRSLCF